MTWPLWLALAGVLLVLMALSGSVLSRMPVSTAMFYLGAGVLAGPLALGLAAPQWQGQARLLEHLTEVIVLLSLFTSGLKMSVGLHDRRWLPPLRLALLSMVVTVALITAAGVWLLGLPLGVAVLLGGILAPTDPVLATEVQVANPEDRDQLRFALTGEGGLNDGTAFPVVMLGLGLVGAHDIGAWGWRWWAVDVLWASAAGLAVGATLGTALGRLVLWLRRQHQAAEGYENFLALGLIGLSYGLAVLAQGYGFLAVFAAGLALRHAQEAVPRPSTDDLSHAVMSFNEQLDRIGEMVGVVLLGLMLATVPWVPAALWFVPLALLVVRPVAVQLGLAGSRTSHSQRRLIGWFGIRGIGSLYYLNYALSHGLPAAHAPGVVGLTVAVVVSSIVVHGVSVTPLMARYRQGQQRRGR
ncbi:sodium:proton antiporter [beta proteobacterium AAP51]|nr:sodium:proton antiporter [beta proteobacterium AAP51]